MRRRSPYSGQMTLPLLAADASPAATSIVASPLLAAPSPTPASALAPAPSASIAVVRRRGTRRYVLRVLDDGTVRVTVPWWGSRREALAFAASQQAWIDRQRERRRAQAPPTPWRPGRLVLVDGESHPLEGGDDGSIWLCGQRVSSRSDDADQVKRGVHAWLRTWATRELPPALLALAAEHEITVTRVTIRDQVSRWGSCSRQGVISLNWRLVQLPPWVRHYVLVHELMHRRQLNHSPRYWKLVAAACPRYLEARRWLRTEGQTLFG